MTVGLTRCYGLALTWRLQASCASSSRRWASRTCASNLRTTLTPRSVISVSYHPGWHLCSDPWLPCRPLALQPSLEIFAFHPQLKKWVEVGNSGMFRPEMLEPMGFPKDVHVHGWGISLERPTMIRYAHTFSHGCNMFVRFADFSLMRSYGINNIRTLVGHKVSLESVERSPAVRF